MTRPEIENRISPIFSDIMYMNIEEIDNSHPLWGQEQIDELDILELFSAIDDELGSNLFQNRDIDIYRFTIEDLYNMIEREVNK